MAETSNPARSSDKALACSIPRLSRSVPGAVPAKIPFRWHLSARDELIEPWPSLYGSGASVCRAKYFGSVRVGQKVGIID